MRSLEVVGFDADDTLWAHANHYVDAEEGLVRLLSDRIDRESVMRVLRTIEAGNLRLYGFGVKGFTLSMIEVAAEVAGANLSHTMISGILALGRSLLAHPVELMPFVPEVIDRLSKSYTLVLITRGDLLDQERKLSESGLRSYFDSVEIVSDKDSETYRRIFGRYAAELGRAVMVGNSLRSDVVPALTAGAWGIYIPRDIVWALDHAETPTADRRFRQLNHFGELPAALEDIEAGLRTSP